MRARRGLVEVHVDVRIGFVAVVVQARHRVVEVHGRVCIGVMVGRACRGVGVIEVHVEVGVGVYRWREDMRWLWRYGVCRWW